MAAQFLGCGSTERNGWLNQTVEYPEGYPRNSLSTSSALMIKPRTRNLSDHERRATGQSIDAALQRRIQEIRRVKKRSEEELARVTICLNELEMQHHRLKLTLGYQIARLRISEKCYKKRDKYVSPELLENEQYGDPVALMLENEYSQLLQVIQELRKDMEKTTVAIRELYEIQTGLQEDITRKQYALRVEEEALKLRRRMAYMGDDLPSGQL